MKSSGQVELFQNQKDDAVKVLNMAVNLQNSAVAIGLEKVSFHFNPKERQCQRMFKLISSMLDKTDIFGKSYTQGKWGEQWSEKAPWRR